MRTAASPLVAGLILAAISSVTTADDRPSYHVLGSDRGKVAIVDQAGKVEWEVGNPAEVHELALLPSGNVMFTTSGPKVVEMSPRRRSSGPSNPGPPGRTRVASRSTPSSACRTGGR